LESAVKSQVEWVQPDGLKLGAAPTSSTDQTKSIIEAPAPMTLGQTQPATAGANGAAAESDAGALALKSSPITASATIKPRESFPILAPEGHDVPQERTATVAIATDALQKRLATRIRDFPRDSAGHLDFQLMQFLQDRPAPDLAALASLPTEDREVLTILMDGMTNFRSLLRNDSNMLLSRKVRPLLEMSDRLRSQVELTLPTVALCKAVRGFGLYDPIEADQIPAGRETKAIVYCEVANFASQLDEKQLWRTKLSQEVVLYTEDQGIPVWRKAPEPVVDLCRNRRHDFYAYSFIKFPQQLAIGRYMLKVTVTDQQANRVSEATLPVSVVAP
jgi:hypothetical protein